jgi:hypothetical protein
MRHPILFSLVLALMVSGCGGGGGGGGGDGGGGEADSGGDNSGDSTTGNSPPTVNPVQNQLPIVVGAGPTNMVNIPFVKVTICSPGTNNCQTIDHVIVDTASSGLRIMSSALAPSLTLPPVKTSNDELLNECMQFVSGYTWGQIRYADVKLGGHTLGALAVQIIGDVTAGDTPGSCANTGASINTVQSFGGNGVLGVGGFAQDCGSACAGSAIAGTYYTCSGTSCRPVSVLLDRQVQNPIASLSSDNNGVVLELPDISSSGASSVNGTLTLGIGTQANNSLGNATILGLKTNTLTFVTKFNGVDYTGFLDTGSNGLFFPDRTLPPCLNSSFYCPATVQHLTATNTGTNSVASTVNFQVGNARTLFSSGNFAFSNLAGSVTISGGGHFDWGLPFFFGRKVFTAIEGRSTPGGTGPYVAY